MLTKDFLGFLPGNVQIPFPAYVQNHSEQENFAEVNRVLELVEKTLQSYQNEVVGIIVEPIQGAGGHRIALKEFFQGLSRLSNQYEVGLGFDEVQTAGGQTGTFFAVEQFDLPYPPHAIASAKKMGTGVVIMSESMDDEGVLDSTWGGHLVDMIRFTEEMKIVRKEKLIEQVQQKSEHLNQHLDNLVFEFPHLIHNRRGMGIYQGFSFYSKEHKSVFLETMLQEKNYFLMGAGPESIRLRPTLDISLYDCTDLASTIQAVLRSL
jgi:L-lysine 6-transaminase